MEATQTGQLNSRSPQSKEANKNYWYSLAKKWEQSGLTQTQFCRENNLRSSRLSAWIIVFRQSGLMGGKTRPNKSTVLNRNLKLKKQSPFTRVVTKSETPSFTQPQLIELKLSETTSIKMTILPPPEWLAQVMKAARS